MGSGGSENRDGVGSGIGIGTGGRAGVRVGFRKGEGGAPRNG